MEDEVKEVEGEGDLEGWMGRKEGAFRADSVGEEGKSEMMDEDGTLGDVLVRGISPSLPPFNVT